MNEPTLREGLRAMWPTWRLALILSVVTVAGLSCPGGFLWQLDKTRTGTRSCDPYPLGCPEGVDPCDDPEHPDYGTIVCCDGDWDMRYKVCTE